MVVISVVRLNGTAAETKEKLWKKYAHLVAVSGVIS